MQSRFEKKVGRFLVLTLAATVAAGAKAEELRLDTTGLYPIWESTGHVEEGGSVRVSTTGAQVGIRDLAHVGVLPLYFIDRTPNGYVKVVLPAPQGWHVAAQVGAYRLLEGASHAFFSPMFSSRLDNTDFAVNLIPVSVSASYDVTRWLEIHQTLTSLAVLAPGHLESRVTPGYSVAAEINPRGRHGLTLHAMDVGIWTKELAVAGASYRYRNGWAELRLGYFYRFTSAGVQASPLASFGVLL
jgi:hypothetical protein